MATPQPDECLHRIAVDEVTGPSPAASADGRADDEPHLSVRPMEPDEIGRVVDYFHDADDEINVHQTVNRRQFGSARTRRRDPSRVALTSGRASA